MKNILFILGMGLMLGACTSEKNAPYLEDQFDKAIAFNDNLTAIYFLHELRALDPNNNTVYIRLADLYSKIGNHKGALTAANIAMDKANELEQKDLLFVKFRALKATKQNASAVGVLDTLILLDKERELEYLYEGAVLSFEVKEFVKAQERMEQVFRHPLADKTNKTLLSDLGQDKVSYKAAAINFIAYLKLMNGDIAVAEQMYDNLLAQNQQFKLAQNNYQLLQKAKKVQAEKKNK